ncbi:MAG: LD-carboxypeptidase [Caryophanon sp.]|nr:LD-carboxypeptidase [Caryophanon sp.]
MKQRPQRLQMGDTVGIIAPASPLSRERLSLALPMLERLGLRYVLADSVIEGDTHYLAKSDEQRVEEIHAMFKNPEIKAIICARGGYGTGRLLDKLDYPLIEENPKIFWGYSDITALHTVINEYANLVTFHGDMLGDASRDDFSEASERMFLQLMQPWELHYDETRSPLTAIVGGTARGELTGGNLTLLTSTLGSKYEIDTRGKILVIEDVEESPLHVDRMLNQLRLARKFEGLAGIVIGSFTYSKSLAPQDSTFDAVFDDYFGKLNVPVVKGFSIGHCEPNFAIPFGVDALLDGDAKALTILPGVE